MHVALTGRTRYRGEFVVNKLTKCISGQFISFLTHEHALQRSPHRIKPESYAVFL